MCYLGCSGGMRLLHNFTSAGLGVSTSWISGRPSLDDLPLCLWVIAPQINKLNSPLQDDFESLSQQLFYSTVNDSDADSHFSLSTDSRISLQFRNNQTSQCYDETVLIYSGLPQFLTPFNSSLTPDGFNHTEQGGTLVGVFTGAQLKSQSVTIPSSIVAVVYYASTTPSSQLLGFNLTVNIDHPPGMRDLYPMTYNTTDEVHVSDW